MEHTQEQTPRAPTSSMPPVMAPVLMMAFWMLLGAAFGIRLMESVWRLFGVSVGEVSIVVPVGGAIGALGAAYLGLITNPRLLVLLMAVFAGSAAGAVAGKLPWGDVGEIAGQLIGGLVGGMAWAVWLYFGQGRNVVFDATGTLIPGGSGSGSAFLRVSSFKDGDRLARDPERVAPQAGT